jgi:hypothetical protein
MALRIQIVGLTGVQPSRTKITVPDGCDEVTAIAAKLATATETKVVLSTDPNDNWTTVNNGTSTGVVMISGESLNPSIPTQAGESIYALANSLGTLVVYYNER